MVDGSSTWQHQPLTGRRRTGEAVLLKAMLVRQLDNATFRQTEGLLRTCNELLGIDQVPDHTTLSRWNATGRFCQVLRRFHRYLHTLLPTRDVVAAVDSTGYSNSKVPWTATPYPARAAGQWLKSHCIVELPSLRYLGCVITRGGVHDSQPMRELLEELPPNVRIKRLLGDGAYSGDPCMQAVRDAGITPMFDFRADSRFNPEPMTVREKGRYFEVRFPRRKRALMGLRSLIETAFGVTKGRFGHRLRCRAKIARRNEIRAKQILHDVRISAAIAFTLGG